MKQAVIEPIAVRRHRTAEVLGGAGFVAAGLLLLVGGLPFAVGASPEQGVSAWQLLCWPLGGVVLLGAGALLARAPHDEGGLVGSATRSQVAVIVTSTEPLLLTAVAALSWTAMGLTQLLLAVIQALTAGAAVVVAVGLAGTAARAGAFRWCFVAIALVDAVALVLAVVPQGLPAFQFVVAIARPLVVVVTGAVLLARQRRP